MSSSSARRTTIALVTLVVAVGSFAALRVTATPDIPLAASNPAAATPTASPASVEDEAMIRATVERYFQGMMEGSAATLRSAFDPGAVLIGTAEDGAALQRIPFAPWADSWDGRILQNSDRYRNRITHVDITGDAAVVRTELVWPGVHYVDYLSLLKVNGEWRIVNKIWTTLDD